MREVSGILGVKQSAGDLKLMADLVLDVPKGKLILTAVDALLYPSFALGSPGTIAALPSAAPAACVALWDAVQQGNHAQALELHQRLLRLWNEILGDNLPACTKYALKLQGCDAGLPRQPMPAASSVQQAAIAPALKDLMALSGARVAVAAE